eukprot:12743437-Alexandrium_andersonii.AAC.1
MSASLVGSEMCIRDSGSHRPQTQAREPARQTDTRARCRSPPPAGSGALPRTAPATSPLRPGAHGGSARHAPTATGTASSRTPSAFSLYTRAEPLPADPSEDG